MPPLPNRSASNGTFYLSCSNDRSFRKLVACIDAPALLEDPRFATNADRCANGATLSRELAAIGRCVTGAPYRTSRHLSTCTEPRCWNRAPARNSGRPTLGFSRRFWAMMIGVRQR